LHHNSHLPSLSQLNALKLSTSQSSFFKLGKEESFREIRLRD
jgi:hypothetical protein